MGQAQPDPAVRSIEQYLAETVDKLDQWLDQGQAIRSEFALRLHALREAENPAVTEAVDDYLSRAAEGQPYKDAVDVEDLVSSIRPH